MGSDGVDDLRRSNNTKWIAESMEQITLDGEDWYDVRHGRLIITPDGVAKEEEDLNTMSF